MTHQAKKKKRKKKERKKKELHLKYRVYIHCPVNVDEPLLYVVTTLTIIKIWSNKSGTRPLCHTPTSQIKKCKILLCTTKTFPSISTQRKPYKHGQVYFSTSETQMLLLLLSKVQNRRNSIPQIPGVPRVWVSCDVASCRGWVVHAILA